MPVKCPICNETILSVYACTQFPQRVCHNCIGEFCEDVDFEHYGEKFITINGTKCSVESLPNGGTLIQVLQK